MPPETRSCMASSEWRTSSKNIRTININSYSNTNSNSDSDSDSNAVRSSVATVTVPLQRLGAARDAHTYTVCLLGDSQNFSHAHAAPVRELPLQLDAPIAQVSCGIDWMLLLTNKGRVYAFGNNTYGQLAQGHQQVLAVPKPIVFPVEKRILRVSCGSSHGGLVLDSGALFMFGCGSYGRLGTGSGTSQLTPVAVRMHWSELHAQAADIAQHAATAIPGGGSTTATTSKSARPSPAAPPASLFQSQTSSDDDVAFTDVSCGDRHTLVLATTTMASRPRSAVISFGDGMNGRLGLGSERDQMVGALVPALVNRDLIMVSAGTSHSAAMTSSGELWTWGNGADGQLGHQVLASEWTPREVVPLRGTAMAAVRCGARHTVAVSRMGVVYTWGRGLEGQLGTGRVSNAAQPTRIPLTLDPLVLQQMQLEAQLAAASASGSSGSTGLATSALSSSSAGSAASRIDPRVLVRHIVARDHTTLVLDEQARLFAWGDNTAGKLGFPAPSNLAPPLATSLNPTESQGSGTVAGGIAPTIRQLTPRQLLYMELREPPRAVTRVTTLRDRMLSMANSLTRVALEYVEASDRFTALVFRTTATRMGSVTNTTMDGTSRRLLPFTGSSRGQEASTDGLSPASFAIRTPTSTLANAQTKWTLSLLEELPVSDIPSREASYYNYMVSYKVHIHKPRRTAHDEEEVEEEEEGENNEMEDDHGLGDEHQATGARRADRNTTAHGGGGGTTGRRQRLKTSRQVRVLEDQETVEGGGGRGVVPMRPTTPRTGLHDGTTTAKAIPRTTERVRGYEQWLKRRCTAVKLKGEASRNALTPHKADEARSADATCPQRPSPPPSGIPNSLSNRRLSAPSRARPSRS